jgi:hypothetical protein
MRPRRPDRRASFHARRESARPSKKAVAGVTDDAARGIGELRDAVGEIVEVGNGVNLGGDGAGFGDDVASC